MTEIPEGRVAVSIIENSQYFYQVQVSNEYGAMMSKPVEISEFHVAIVIASRLLLINVVVTTDVQSVTVSRLERDTYSIQCNYITGSDAIGCVYTLVSNKKEVSDLSGTLKRTSLGGMVVEIPNVGCYREVLAYDLERDNTTGTLPIRGEVNFSEPCDVGVSQGIINAT